MSQEAPTAEPRSECSTEPVAPTVPKRGFSAATRAPQWKKGQSGNPSGRPKGPQKRTLRQLGRTLVEEVEHELARNNGADLSRLAKSIVEGAIAREPSCLAFIAPRFAPVLDQATSGKTIIQGIRLEVTTSEASTVHMDLLAGANPSGEASLQPPALVEATTVHTQAPSGACSDVNGES